MQQRHHPELAVSPDRQLAALTMVFLSTTGSEPKSVTDCSHTDCPIYNPFRQLAAPTRSSTYHPRGPENCSIVSYSSKRTSFPVMSGELLCMPSSGDLLPSVYFPVEDTEIVGRHWFSGDWASAAETDPAEESLWGTWLWGRRRERLKPLTAAPSTPPGSNLTLMPSSRKEKTSAASLWLCLHSKIVKCKSAALLHNEGHTVFSTRRERRSGDWALRSCGDASNVYQGPDPSLLYNMGTALATYRTRFRDQNTLLAEIGLPALSKYCYL